MGRLDGLYAQLEECKTSRNYRISELPVHQTSTVVSFHSLIL